MRIRNFCSETITIYLRYPRPKRKDVTRPTSFKLGPKQASHPLPLHVLLGAKGWGTLTERECVRIEPVSYEPRFVQITNLSAESIELAVRPAVKAAEERKSTLRVKPGEKSRTVDVRSISQRRRLRALAARRQVSVTPVYEIGPSTRRGGAIASYADEDVYICYECGGPIVFRGNPPRPVHL